MSKLMKMKEMDATLLTLDLVGIVNSWGDVEGAAKVESALRLAAELHVNDFRRSARSNVHRPPYIEHVLRVALRPIKYFEEKSIDMVVAALLHDTVEDHAKDFFEEDYSEEEARIRLLDFYARNYGENVSDAVAAVTNPIMDKKMSKQEKRETYVNHVKESVIDNDMAFIVKVSDFIDNAGSLYLTNKNESVDGATKHLLAKYSPLVSFFINHAENVLNGAQKDEVINRLNRVSDSLDTLRA